MSLESNSNEIRPHVLGDRVVVLGAGIGGCFAAAALSKYFQSVLVLDKDELPDGPLSRRGVGQGLHIHGLLRRPFDIACKLLPGFEDDLRRAGGIKLQLGEQSFFHDAGAWHPKRDLGVAVYAQSRPLLEHVLRSRVAGLANVTFQDRTRVEDYIIHDGRIVAVGLQSDKQNEVVDADLVIDSTGRAGAIVDRLARLGYSDLESVELGVQISYTSAYFTRPAVPGKLPSGYVVRSNPPKTRSGVLWPIEGDKWVISLSGRFSDFPPADDEGFREFARSLEDPIVHEAIERESRVTPFVRFNIPRIYWRRFDRMSRFPDRLIPLGDTVAGFNPVYGQGMAVASLQVEELQATLAAHAAVGRPLDGISSEVLPRIAAATEAAWSMTEPVDLVFEKTTGARPQGFAERIAFAGAVRRAIVADDELHRAWARVANLIEDPSALVEILGRSESAKMSAAADGR